MISISFLTKHNYLTPETWKKDTIDWSINRNKISSIGIQVNTVDENQYLELNYKCNDKPINYKVQLVSILLLLSTLQQPCAWPRTLRIL